MSKYTSTTRNRQGNGEFAPAKRVATFAEQVARDQHVAAVAASTEHRGWMEAHGLGDYQPDELFASVRK